MRNLRVAAWQIDSARTDVEGNLRRLAQILTDREVARCDLLVAPEMFLTGFQAGKQHEAQAEDGPVFQKISTIVADAGVSFATSILVERGRNRFNTLYLWDDEGTLIGKQDKIHLWADESKRATPGEATRPLLTEWGPVGGMVCYDVEFPEVGRTLALEGAELFVVPSAFYSPTGWDIATRARALENGCYLVAANQVGGDPKHPHNGMSRIVDPFGTVVAEVASGREGVITAELDGNLIVKARQAAPFLRDRRLGVTPPALTRVVAPKRA
jgi:predicted amidohydrolase